MLDAFERFVLLYDLCLRTARKELEFDELEKIVPAIQKYVADNKAVLILPSYEDGAAPWLRIKRAKVVTAESGAKFLALLFTVSDPRASNPVFEHSETAKLRVVRKAEKEGKSVSAHCLISLKMQASQRYRMVVEDIRGLGKTRIRDMIGHVLKALSDELNLEYENNSGETKSTYILPDLQGYRSEKLAESVNRGTVTGVYLVDSRPQGAMDEVDGAYVTRREIKVEMGSPKKGNKIDRLEQIRSWGAGKGYDRLRIVWNDPEGAGKPERASVDTTQNDVKDTYFVKQVKVKVSQPLDDACEEIRDDIIEAIIKQVK